MSNEEGAGDRGPGAGKTAKQGKVWNVECGEWSVESGVWSCLDCTANLNVECIMHNVECRKSCGLGFIKLREMWAFGLR